MFTVLQMMYTTRRVGYIYKLLGDDQIYVSYCIYRPISRGRLLAQKMRVFTYYRPISQSGNITSNYHTFFLFPTFFSSYALHSLNHSIRAFFFTYQYTCFKMTSFYSHLFLFYAVYGTYRIQQTKCFVLISR